MSDIKHIDGEMVGGMMTGIAPHRLSPNESPDSQNLDPANPLGAVTRLGSAIYGVTGPGAASGYRGTGLFPWTRNAGSFGNFLCYGTTIYLVDSASWLSVKTGVTSGGMMQGAALNNIGVIVAAGIGPQISTTGTALATMASTGSGTYFATLAKYVTTWQSKLWLTGNDNQPNRCHFSKSGDPEDLNTVNDAGYVDVDKDDGDIIYGFLGAKRILAVFKRRTTHIITGTKASDYNATKLCGNGIVSEWAYASDGTGVFWASDDGIYYAQGAQVSRMSDANREFYVNTITDKSTISLEVKGEKLFVFYKVSGTENTGCLVLAYKRMVPNGRVQGVWSVYTAQPYHVARLTRTNNLYALTNASSAQIYELDVGTSGSVAAYWNSPDLDFEEIMKIKKLERFFLHVKPPNATTTFTIRVFADGASVGSDYTVTVGTTGSHSFGLRFGQITSAPVGHTLRLKISWTGQATVYGYRVVADVKADSEPGRV